MSHAEHQRAYVARNRARVNAERRAAYAANPSHHRAVQAKSRAKIRWWLTRAARAASFAFQSNARATKWGHSERLTATEVRRIEGPCSYCGLRAMGWDHILPLCRGGSNTTSNLVSCCKGCNAKKARRTPAEAGMSVSA